MRAGAFAFTGLPESNRFMLSFDHERAELPLKRGGGAYGRVLASWLSLGLPGLRQRTLVRPLRLRRQPYKAQ